MVSTTTDRIGGLSTSVTVKAPCRVVSATNLVLSGEQTVNGTAVVAGDRVLVISQTNAVDNGIYEVSTGAWSRSPDFDGARDVVYGTLVFASLPGEGSFYRLTTPDPIVIGTSNITLTATLFGSTASALPYTDRSASTPAYFDLYEQTTNGTNRVRFIAASSLSSDVTISTPSDGGPYVIAPFTAASASGPASQEFAEQTTNGTSKVTLKAPATLAASADVTLPASGTLATLAGDEALSNKSATFKAGTTSVAPIALTSGANLTTAAAGSVEYNGKVIYATPQSTQRGVVPAEQWYRLDAGLAGANGTSAQNVLGVSFGVSASTVYEFEAVINLSKSAGTTSHVISWLFGLGGGASINNISYQLTGDSSTVSFNSGFGTRFSVAPQVDTAITIYSGLTSANQFIVLNIKGTVSVNTAGTLTPQYILSAAPGGAYTTAQGSFFKIKPIGASGANVSVGNIS